MNALIVKQYCIKISIKKMNVVGKLEGFIIFKNRVKFIQVGQRHRRQVTSSVFDYNRRGGGGAFWTHVTLVEVKIYTCISYF